MKNFEPNLQNQNERDTLNFVGLRENVEQEEENGVIIA